MENQYNVGSIFAAYASFTAFLTLVKQFYHQFVPDQIREYIDEKVKEWFSKKTILDPKLFTLVVHQSYQEPYGYSNHNHVYDACQVYLADKLRSLSTRLEGFCGEREDPVEYQLSQGEEYVEFVEIDKTDPKKVKLQWKFFCKNDKGEEVDNGSFKSFQVSVDLKHKDQLLDYYIPSVVVKNHNKLLEMKKDIYLYTYNSLSSNHWNEVSFNHPFTFDALALDPDLKKSIVDDLERFIRRKDFYKKIGKAWKRGYLLYGPPGTGKSSLIAAIANHLKFNVYDLQLGGIERDSVFRNLMMSISNKSILVIEDIDCASGLSRKNVVLPRSSGGYGSGDDDDNNNIQETPPVQNDNLELSLSGLLNFIDGLWSSCGDERIIILTTNYKERLDPALLRPGRMDMHIHMSYLRMPAFRILASNYLDLSEHPLFQEIEELLGKTDVSPAEVAEQLIRSEDPDVALSGVVDMLKQNKKKVRKMKKEEKNDDDDDNSKSSSESLAKKPKNGGECASHTQLTEEALD